MNLILDLPYFPSWLKNHSKTRPVVLKLLLPVTNSKHSCSFHRPSYPNSSSNPTFNGSTTVKLKHIRNPKEANHFPQVPQYGHTWVSHTNQRLICHTYVYSLSKFCSISRHVTANDQQKKQHFSPLNSIHELYKVIH